jgi:hypothetical protein
MAMIVFGVGQQSDLIVGGCDHHHRHEHVATTERDPRREPAVTGDELVRPILELAYDRRMKEPVLLDAPREALEVLAVRIQIGTQLIPARADRICDDGYERAGYAERRRIEGCVWIHGYHLGGRIDPLSTCSTEVYPANTRSPAGRSLRRKPARWYRRPRGW